jgi:hypothetical protein
MRLLSVKDKNGLIVASNLFLISVMILLAKGFPLISYSIELESKSFKLQEPIIEKLFVIRSKSSEA